MPRKNTRLSVILLVLIPIALSIFLSLYRDHVESKPATVGPRYEIRNLESRLLSQARNATVFHNFAIVYPQPKVLETSKNLPLIIHIPAFGEDHRLSKVSFKRMKQLLDLRLELSAIHIFLDPTGPHNHHYFVDSATNGPVGTALVQELIPELQRILPVGKFYLTGHSSGGWSALWLQLEYPKLFSGVWATSPDPIDFRDFYGVDLTSESATNLYFGPNGAPRKAVRGRSINLKQFVEEEEEEDPEGNEWVSMEAAFSPLNSTGEPRKLFDRRTGEIIHQVATDWRRFNLSKKVASFSSAELENLKNKIHLFCGSKDDFFLDAPFGLFCKELEKLPINGHCELIEGKTHNTIYQPSKNAPDGLVLRIWEEIASLNAN